MGMLLFGLGYIALGGGLLYAAFKRKPETQDESILDAEVIILPSAEATTSLPPAQMSQTAAAAKRILS